MKYIKKPISIQEQIDLLKVIGLLVRDDKKLCEYLTHVGYYQLGLYFSSFQNSINNFKDNIYFEDIINIYVFDKKLRLLLLDTLEIIEKSFKCKLIQSVAINNNDVYWINNQHIFQSEKKYEKYIKNILNNIKNSKDEIIRKYYFTFKSLNFPPSWLVIDSLTFGESVNVFRWLNIQNRNKFSREYGLDEKYLLSWIYGLSVLRNICAHHSRLWNRELFARVKINSNLYSKYFNKEINNRLYNYLVILQIMMCKINSTSTWIDKLAILVNVHKINHENMGFPSDWLIKMAEIKKIITFK